MLFYVVFVYNHDPLQWTAPWCSLRNSTKQRGMVYLYIGVGVMYVLFVVLCHGQCFLLLYIVFIMCLAKGLFLFFLGVSVISYVLVKFICVG